MTSSCLPILGPQVCTPADGGPALREDEQIPMASTASFGDMLSALNPLHHIPVVGWIYRQITGETIQPAFRAIGGLLTGGPIGAIASAVAALAEELVGQADFGVFGGGTAVAEAAPAAGVAVAAPAAAAPTGAATSTAAPAAPVGLAAQTTTAGTPLQPLPLATRLAARAYPSPLAIAPLAVSPPPLAAPGPVAALPDVPARAAEAADAASGFVPAAEHLATPARAAATPHPAPEDIAVPPPTPQSATPQSATPQPVIAQPAIAQPAARIRRAPIIPISAGGQDPAFVQRMMQGLEAYDRAMRGRAVPAAAP